MNYKLKIFYSILFLIVLNVYSQTQQKYNVVLIAVDDMNDFTGFMSGHPQAITPNMDKLASKSVVFKNAMCATSECNPSRAAMLSGYHPKTTGFTNNFLPVITREWIGKDEIGKDVAHYSKYQIPDMKNQKTLPQWFRENGYHTMGTGKIFHHHESGKWVDQENSWDEWSVPKGVSLFEKRNLSQIYDGKILWEDWGPVDVSIDETSDYKRAEWAAKKLNSYNSDKPFFLAVGFKKPHDPFYAPKEFFERFPKDDKDIILPIINDDDLNDVPRMGKLMADKVDGVVSEYEIVAGKNKFHKDFRRDIARAYLATIAYVDSCVGVVTNALEKSKFKNNTIVLLWSDHGLHLGEKLHYHKFTFWDEALRTNLLISVPGVKPDNCYRNVNAIDIYPTLVQLCNLPNNYLQKGFDKQGHSLVPLLNNPSRKWNIPSLTVDFKRFHPMTSQKRGEKYTDNFLAYGLRTERFKFIEYVGEQDNSYREYELYDLYKDPNEWTNLAGKPKYKAIQEKLRQLIHKFPGGEDGSQKMNTAPTIIVASSYADKNETRLNIEVLDIDSEDDIDRIEYRINDKVIKIDKTLSTDVVLKGDYKGKELEAIVFDKANNLDKIKIKLK